MHVERGPDPLAAVLDAFGIGVVLDVGANVGQYARELRLIGYDRQIVSFEPSSAAFEALSSSAKRDKRLTAVQLALGTERGTVTLNVYEHSTLNSVRPLLASYAEAWGEHEPGKEVVSLERLDAVFASCVPATERAFLKIDTQGSERTVLDGATGVLNRIAGIQLEVSFAPLYEGEPTMMEMVQHLAELGFTLISMRPLHHFLHSARRDRDASLIWQADAIFVRL